MLSIFLLFFFFGQSQDVLYTLYHQKNKDTTKPDVP